MSASYSDAENCTKVRRQDVVSHSLVVRAEQWKWSSLPLWERGESWLRGRRPAVRGKDWLARVNAPLSAGDLSRVRLSAERGRPYGDETWARETVNRLGLESTVRSRGRPRKNKED